jgi:hypothetical protein
VAIIAIDIEIAASNERPDFDPVPDPDPDPDFDFDFEELGEFDAASILDPSANSRSLRTV